MVIILCVLLNTTIAAAATINWSNITLSGSHPNFSFTDPTLGTVSLAYSGDTEVYGISKEFAGVDTLQFGNTGGESLTMSWSNPVVDMNIQIWDIDAIRNTIGESVSLTANATVSSVSIHTTDVWMPSTQTLGNDGTANPNGSADNFSVINFYNSSGFDSITFNWAIDTGTGRMGIGEVQVVPLPPAIYLLGAGIVGLLSFRKRKTQQKES